MGYIAEEKKNTKSQKNNVEKQICPGSDCILVQFS